MDGGVWYSKSGMIRADGVGQGMHFALSRFTYEERHLEGRDRTWEHRTSKRKS